MNQRPAARISTVLFTIGDCHTRGPDDEFFSTSALTSIKTKVANSQLNLARPIQISWQDRQLFSCMGFLGQELRLSDMGRKSPISAEPAKDRFQYYED
jgi:hypothetical protein